MPREWPRTTDDSGEGDSGQPAKRRQKKRRGRHTDTNAETQEAHNLLNIYQQLLTSEADLAENGEELPPEKKTNLDFLLAELTARGLLNDPRAVEIREEAAARRKRMLERRRQPEAERSDTAEAHEPELAGEARERAPGAEEKVPFEPPADTTAAEPKPAEPNPEETAPLHAAIKQLAELTPEARSNLEREANVWLSNHEIPLTDRNRTQQLREASIRILREYSPESLERTLHPERFEEPAPAAPPEPAAAAPAPDTAPAGEPTEPPPHGTVSSADLSPPPADHEPQPQGHPLSFEEENLVAEATWDLAKRRGIYNGEAYELLLKTIGKPAEPLTRESLNRIVDELAPPLLEPTAAENPPPVEPALNEASLAEQPSADGLEAKRAVLDETTLAEHPTVDGPEAEYPPLRREVPAAPKPRGRRDIEELMRAIPGPTETDEERIKALAEGVRTGEAERPAEGRGRKLALARSLFKHLGTTAAKTAASLVGVKILYDLPAWIREKRALAREREDIRRGLMEFTIACRARRREQNEGRPKSPETREYLKTAIKQFKEALGSARHLSPAEQREYRKRLLEITTKHRKFEADLYSGERGKIGKLSKLYLTNKISGYRVAREALNTALVLGGMPVFRGAAYAATAMLERGAKAGREFEKANWDADHAPSFWAKKIAQAKDVFVTSALETTRALTFRAEKGQRAAKFVEAAGKLATGYGIGSAALQGVFETAPTEGITKLLDAFEHDGASGAVRTTAENFWKNFNDMAARFTTLRFDRAKPGMRGSTAGVSLSDEARGIEAAAPPTHDASLYEAPAGMDESQIRAFQETAPTEPVGLSEHEIQQLHETAKLVTPEVPAPTLESLAEARVATIEKGSNVWDTATRLVAEGKVSPGEFARDWEHSVRTLPDLVHPGDVVKHIPGVGGSPGRFEVIPESGLSTGSAKDLADIYERLGKKVPPWLQEKIEPSPSLPAQVRAAIEVPSDEFSADLADIRTDFVRGDLAKQTAAIHQLQDMRESLEFVYRDAAGSPEQAEIREHLQRLDAIRHELLYAPEYTAQTKAFESLLADTEVPEAKRALLKTLTVDRLLAERHSSQFFDLNALTQRIERYLAIIPSRERPRELTVETFLQKFVVGGKVILAA